MRKLLAFVLVAAVATAVAAPGGAAFAKKKRKKASGPVVVGTDPEGDWGENSAVGTDATALGEALGQDLVEAEIGMADKQTINFVIRVSSLPPTGGVPEITRYTWDFTVDGEQRELDGKFTNYTRGVCDPTSGQCPPPRNPGPQPFLVRGECSVQPIGVINFTVCEELALVQATFDAATGTITVPVPLEPLGAKPGSKIVGVPGTFGGTITAAPAVFATFDSFPMDLLNTDRTFVVPKK